MSSIITDFSQVYPYLDGSKFKDTIVVQYRGDGDVRYRCDVLVDICRGKRVLHVGCCDHLPLIKRKIENRDWLHGLITECSEYTVGVDIDADAVREASRISGLDNMVAGDVTSGQKIDAISGRKFDIAVFGEVVEHIPNPVSFLSRFRENYGDVVDQIVITVPNAFRGGNIKGILKNVETINSDHRFFFTPYTIAKVAIDAGYAPVEVKMATFMRAGKLKSMLLRQLPLLAEDIIFIGAATPARPH
ncbi:class I SAM-dependent methyltransferase [Bradyrhizobium sp. Pa8]|uniref:class I SAM-dependent methyltransferase n=1 Tax=Bradyrhizobium sp. Pa8 TaxID=3386552 RepID=UPI00403F2CFF